MQVVDGITGALLDLFELQLMPYTNTGDEMIQAAHNHKPVITAGAQPLQWLQHELALDRVVADLGRYVCDDQINWVVGCALKANAANCCQVCHVIERSILA